jgi:hypothetical protein
MRRFLSVAVMVAALGIRAGAAEYVPFKATWSGTTTAVDGSGFPIVVVVAEGEGQGTHLGRFTMVSPHANNVFTFELWGDQNFTAANGDTVSATFSGQLTPTIVGGNLVAVSGTIPCVITGGTGRFAGARGSYNFTIYAVPLPDRPGFASTATIDGEISTVGSSN